MSETVTQDITFHELVDRMAAIREKGGTELVKRENFMDFPQLSRGIRFNKENFMAFASFGYMERLFRKLASAYPEEHYENVIVESFREACGFFAGTIHISFAGNTSNKTEIIEFAWSGRGSIESTWDLFTTWKTKTSQD